MVSLIIGLLRYGAEGLTDGLSIIVALIIITVVNSANNYASERKLRDLVALTEEQTVGVYRNSSQPMTINAKHLVVGDVYLVEAGMKIPADSILLEGRDVACEESDLTGEPDVVFKMALDQENHKNGADCTLLARSLACTGFGRALVVAVGENTVAGIILEKT